MRKEDLQMQSICFLAMTLAIILSLSIALIVILKNGKFSFSLKKDKEKDALLVKAEHQDNGLNKWFSGEPLAPFLNW